MDTSWWQENRRGRLATPLWSAVSAPARRAGRARSLRSTPACTQLTRPPAAYVAAALRALPPSTPGALSSAPVDEHRFAAGAGLLVQPLAAMEVRDAAQGFAFASIGADHDGQPVWLPVIGEAAGWVQVLLPGRPAGATGWLDRSRLTACRSQYELSVHVGAARLDLLARGQATRTWRLKTAAGRTPLGRTYVAGSCCCPGGSPGQLLLAAINHDAQPLVIAATPGSALEVPAAALPLLARVSPGSLVRIYA
jgi:hypothetical protein